MKESDSSDKIILQLLESTCCSWFYLVSVCVCVFVHFVCVMEIWQIKMLWGTE